MSARLVNCRRPYDCCTENPSRSEDRDHSTAEKCALFPRRPGYVHMAYIAKFLDFSVAAESVRSQNRRLPHRNHRTGWAR